MLKLEYANNFTLRANTMNQEVILTVSSNYCMLDDKSNPTDEIRRIELINIAMTEHNLKELQKTIGNCIREIDSCKRK